jgi:CBS domain-containing protein
LIASNIISAIVGPLSIHDTGEEAINIMNVYHVKHLPIVNNNELIGLISEDEILNNNLEEKLETNRLPLFKPYSLEGDHIFETMQKMALNKLTVIPVVDRDMKYVGLITMEDVLNVFGDSYSFKESGSIIILQTTITNYSLGEIAMIAESEGYSILTSFLTTNLDSTEIFVTIKVNSHDISKLIRAFQRRDYIISGAFSEEEYVDSLKERYDSLMNYLSI